jgi:hypothetical protein
LYGLILCQIFVCHILMVGALQRSTVQSAMGCPHRTGFVSTVHMSLGTYKSFIHSFIP